MARLTSLSQVARLRPECSVLFFSSSGATSCDQRPRSRSSGAKLPEEDRSLTRSRVFTEQSRFDRDREIESRDEDVNETQLAQSGKETEISELDAGYFALTISSRVAEQMHCPHVGMGTGQR